MAFDCAALDRDEEGLTARSHLPLRSPVASLHSLAQESAPAACLCISVSPLSKARSGAILLIRDLTLNSLVARAGFASAPA